MSHFSRPMHLFSGYVSAREETRPVRSTPPPSPPPPSSSALLLSSPLFLLPSFAFGFIFNRATHHGTRRSQLCRVTRGASPSLSFSCLSSAYPPPAPFLFLFLSLRGGPFSPLFFLSFFSSPFAATLVFVAPTENGATRRAVGTHYAHVPRALVHFQRKGQTRAARLTLLPRYGCPCRNPWDHRDR